ncbi:Spy/CpxP family protein refolding chaperone [Desulfoferrobacter suflitae]|uniref:Spy/CpxP family protein refolding chaperone n=1 Tax=Desulfoferrobacter suflitae TaxID=2865782 RepID=UPI002164D088|nr:Spy/CpxP family protein refolding chaperone [Desulfoferrobacter suflitae]MCK8603673.1 Spy/CpxP family protein refolding chaperone [Desulfoferrobacter suflitae]
MKKSSILIVFMILAASNAWAYRGGCGMGPGFGMSSDIASSLNLSEEQKAQIQARQEVFQDEINPLRDELFSKRMELRELWAKASPEQSLISAKQKEIQAIQNQIQEKTTQYQLECRELLTPEQQEKLGTTVAHHGGWGGPGRKMHNW